MADAGGAREMTWDPAPARPLSTFSWLTALPLPSSLTQPILDINTAFPFNPSNLATTFIYMQGHTPAYTHTRS